jgi:transcriptional antiterminator
MIEPLNNPHQQTSRRKEFKLSQKALKTINTPITRRRLMDALGCTEFTIARYIQKNSDNLTKAAAMEIIREVTSMADDEILEK